MSHKKKIIFNCIFLLVCFALTMYYVFHGQDFSKIMSYVKDAHSLYWLLGVVLVIGFILGESGYTICHWRTACSGFVHEKGQTACAPVDSGAFTCHHYLQAGFGHYRNCSSDFKTLFRHDLP